MRGVVVSILSDSGISSGGVSCLMVECDKALVVCDLYSGPLLFR